MMHHRPSLVQLAVDTEEALAQLVDKVRTASGLVALDSETSSLKVNEAKVRLLQIRTPSDERPAIVDCQAVDVSPLLEVLQDKHLLGHNIAYDLAVLRSHFGYEHHGSVSDTMLMYQVYYCGTNKRANLKDVLNDVLKIEVSKDEQTSDWFGDLTPEMLSYAAADVAYLHDLHRALQNKVEDKAPGLLPIVDLEHRMALVIAHMSATGMPVDEQVFDECVTESKQAADMKLHELDQQVTAELPEDLVTRNTKNKSIPDERKDKVNWNSPEQVLWTFKAVAGLDLNSTSKEAISKVNHPLAYGLLEYRKALDVYKRFRRTDVVNGRAYAQWNQLKAKTGRMSCEKPPLQGIPEPLRRAFVAPEDRKLVVSDLSQIEIRVLAALCGDENLIADLEAGRDVHRQAAASVFGKHPNEVTDKERKLCKGLVFGTLYGMGLKGFTARVNAWTGEHHLEEQVDRDFRQPLFAPYPKVQKWMNKTMQEYENGKKVTYTRMGRRRLQLSSVPEALNTPIQAGALDVMKAIAVAVYERRHELDCPVEIVGLVHDEILLVVPEDQAEQARDWLDSIMRTVGEEVTNLSLPEELQVPVVANTEVCTSWAEKE